MRQPLLLLSLSLAGKTSFKSLFLLLRSYRSNGSNKLPKKKRGGEGSPGRGRSGIRSTLWREKEKPVSFRTQSASPPQPAGPHSRQSPAEWRGAFRASSQAGRSEMLWWSRVTRRSMFFPYFYASRRRVLRNGQYGSFPLKTVSSCCSTQILGYWLWKY